MVKVPETNLQACPSPCLGPKKGKQLGSDMDIASQKEWSQNTSCSTYDMEYVAEAKGFLRPAIQLKMRASC